MSSGGNVEYMEDILSDEGSPGRPEGQHKTDRGQAPNGSRSSTVNIRDRDKAGRGPAQNDAAHRNTASRNSVQAPINTSGNSLLSTNDTYNNQPKRARVAGPQSDEQAHASVERPMRKPIQPPPTKDYEHPNEKLLGDHKDEPSTSSKRQKRTSAPSPPPKFVHPNNKLLASKPDEPPTSSKNRTRRSEPSPPPKKVVHPNDKLLKNARKRSHEDSEGPSDESENEAARKPRVTRKKSGDNQRKTISAKKLGIPQKIVLSTQELRERRMQPHNSDYDAISLSETVYPLRMGRIPVGGYRLLPNLPLASMKGLNIPGNSQPEDPYDENIDDDDDYLSGLDESDGDQDRELIPCFVDRRTGQLVQASQPLRRPQPPPKHRSTTSASATEFRIRFDENRQIRLQDDAQFDDGYLQQRASRQMPAHGIPFDGSTGLDGYASVREPLDFDEQNPNYLRYQPDALLQQRMEPVPPNMHHQTGRIAAPRRSVVTLDNDADYTEASSVNPRYASLAVSDYASSGSVPAGQGGRRIREPGSGIIIRRQLTTTHAGSKQTPKTPDEIDQVLNALDSGDWHQRAQHYFDSPSPQAAGHSDATQQQGIIRRRVAGDPQLAGSSSSGSRKTSADSSGSSGRDVEYQQRAVKQEVNDDDELDDLSRSPADADDDIDPQQLRAAMEDVALDSDRTYRLQLEARVEQLTTERDEALIQAQKYREYASSAAKRLKQCKCGKQTERVQDAGRPNDSGTGQSSYGSAEQHSRSLQPSSHSQRDVIGSRQHIAVSAAEPSNTNGQYSQSSTARRLSRFDQGSSSTSTNRNGTSGQRSSNTRDQASRAHQSRPIAGARSHR